MQISDSSDTVFTGHDLVDEEGEKIGVIDDVVFDPETQEARWAFVKRGLLNRKPAVVPLTFGYRTTDGSIVVPYDRHTVDAAPKVRGDHVLTSDHEQALRSHYHA